MLHWHMSQISSNHQTEETLMDYLLVNAWKEQTQQLEFSTSEPDRHLN